MNNENDMMNETNTAIPPHAVSLYGQSDAMDDFPVLKAFQQYIDAEQAKAQKRTFWLCIFFAIILTLVIGVFVILLMNVSQRNTALNQQLIQYMMNDRQVLVTSANTTQNDTAMKMLTDSMATLQKQLSEQQMRMIEQQSKFFEQQSKAVDEKVKAAVAEQPPAISPETLKLQEAQKQEALRLKKAAQKLAKEKEAFAKEKKLLQEEKIELQRRKLYPDYYENKDSVEYFDEVEDDELPPPPQKKKATEQSVDAELDTLYGQPSVLEDGTLRYFSDDAQTSEDVTRPTNGWQIPLFDL